MLVRISLVVAVTLLAGCKAPSLVVGVMSQSVVDAGVVAETLPSMGDAFAFDVPRPGVAHITDFSVAFDGQQHLAAWTNTSGVWAVHFSAEGTLLDAAPIQLAPPALVTGAIETLALPGGFVVVWGNGAVPVVATVMNGRHSAPTVVSSARLPGTVQQIHFAGISNGAAAFRVLTVDDEGVFSRTLFVNATTGIALPSNLSLWLNPGTRVPVAKVAQVAWSRAEGRDRLAVLSGRTLQVLVLKPGEMEDHAPATVDPGTSLFAVPFERNLQDLSGQRTLALQAVGDQVVLVWRDFRAATAATTLMAVSMGPTSVSPVTVIDSTPGQVLANDVVATVAGDSVLVADANIVGSGAEKNVLALALDPVSLAVRSRLSCERGANGVFHEFAAASGFAQGRALVFVSEAGHFRAKQVALDGTWGLLHSGQSLPGGVNAEFAPKSVCNLTTCLVSWSDDPAQEFALRGVRLAALTGRVLDDEALTLPPGMFATGPSRAHELVAAPNGFFAVVPGCDSTLYGQEVLIQKIPNTGALPASQRVAISNDGCLSSLVAVAATPSGALVAYGYPQKLVLLTLDANGAMTQRLDIAATADDLRLVVHGSTATLAVHSQRGWSTATFEVNAETVSLAQACTGDDCVLMSRRLLVTPDGSTVGWVDWLQVDVGHWAIRWQPFGQVARVIAEGDGTLNTLEAGFDDDALVVMTTERTFTTDPWTLAVRTFALDAVSPATSRRVVATGVTQLGVALTRAFSGHWLTAYSVGDDSIYAEENQSRLLGRTLTY